MNSCASMHQSRKDRSRQYLVRRGFWHIGCTIGDDDAFFDGGEVDHHGGYRIACSEVAEGKCEGIITVVTWGMSRSS